MTGAATAADRAANQLSTQPTAASGGEHQLDDRAARSFTRTPVDHRGQRDPQLLTVLARPRLRPSAAA